MTLKQAPFIRSTGKALTLTFTLRRIVENPFLAPFKHKLTDNFHPPLLLQSPLLLLNLVL
jgi:hypothetical protein